MLNPRILVADDDSVLLDLLLRRINRLGYQADRAESGSYALELIRLHQYDLIITDIYMPGATGLEVLKAARDKDRDVVVLVITGGATLEKALEALEQGAFFYLTKPFDHLKVCDHIIGKALAFRSLRVGQKKNSDHVSDPVVIESDQQEMKGSLQREHLFEVIEKFPAGIAVLEQQEGFLLCNSSAERLIERYYPSRIEAQQDFISSLNNMNGKKNMLIEVSGKPLTIEACRIRLLYDRKCFLLALHEEAEPQDVRDDLTGPLNYLKKALAWFFKQRLTQDEFQVVRHMAGQVQQLDRLLRSPEE